MGSPGDDNSVGDATFSKLAVIITSMDVLLFMVPDGLITIFSNSSWRNFWFSGNINCNETLQVSFSKLFSIIVVFKYETDSW